MVKMRILVVLIVLLGNSVLAGGIYSYIDERGVKIFTNSPVRRPAETDTTIETKDGDRALAYRPMIEQLSRKHQVDEQLVEAIIAVESNFNPKAVSSKDCKGLMQLHPDTAKRFGVKDVFDPEQNIEGGIKYLQVLTDMFDRNLDHVLAAYNAGENAVQRYQGIPPYRETKDYVRKVSRLYDVSRWEEAASKDAPPATRRVHRIELADGRVVFTNTPSAYAGIGQ